MDMSGHKMSEREQRIAERVAEINAERDVPLRPHQIEYVKMAIDVEDRYNDQATEKYKCTTGPTHPGGDDGYRSCLEELEELPGDWELTEAFEGFPKGWNHFKFPDFRNFTRETGNFWICVCDRHLIVRRIEQNDAFSGCSDDICPKTKYFPGEHDIEGTLDDPLMDPVEEEE